jgi:isopenicillin N synthase-like dioxygenase
MPSTIQLNQADRVSGQVSSSSSAVPAAALLENPESCASDIRNSCIEQGFLYVDLEPSLQNTLDAALFQMDRFFSLEDNHYLKQNARQDERGFGWVPRYSEPAYQPGTLSRLEAFDFCQEHLSEKADSLWPALPDFHSNLAKCWLEYASLGDAVLTAISAAIFEDSHFLLEHCDSRELNTMRLLHYAAKDEEQKANEVGIAAHTDFETITLLYQTAPGLELLDAKGTWLDAPASPGRLVVLIGDMIERWTNGQVHATGHRVRTTDEKRHSIVMFVAANEGIEIAPLPRFVDSTQPPRYEPVTQLGHIENELRRSQMNAALEAKHRPVLVD